MLIKLLTKIFGNYSDRILRRMQKIVDDINELEPLYNKMSDQELKNKTQIFRLSLSKGSSLDDLLPNAFATVREASKRIFSMRHFDVQLLGGIVLHKQCIAEMRTGEGKTLTSTLPAYLNALSQNGVHIVTMNEYLAERDFKKNLPLFSFLGLKVGLNKTGLSTKLKQEAYSADITYGTNNEYGFDYLRDNMIFHSSERVQRKLYYALIDEVDSILIDEARTPLIISGLAEDNSEVYIKMNKIVSEFICQEKGDLDLFYGKGDFVIDEKQKQVYFTDRGLMKLESVLVDNKIINEKETLYSTKNIILIYYITAALRAHRLFMCNVDYIIQNKEIIIIDEHTGRPMLGRRWSDGLHQAIEAKENVEIKNENQTLASITFQNYFRLYEKLSGMTGTAVTESFEFSSVYNLDTIVIPTNRPMIRKDLSDLVFMSEKEKIDAIIRDIQECKRRKQPVLVGTVSIEKSELISSKLCKLKIKHNVLNAKLHSQEAKIIAEAGQLNAITISTNMAGRGTDIVLGGNVNESSNKLKHTSLYVSLSEWKKRHSAVLSVGGLHIIGTERHESRRIDNQLRGRSGRQGDNGSSRFYLSMEDSLMRMFVSPRTMNIMKTLGIKSGEAITHPLVNKVIANAQKKVESHNFDIRKQILEYDNVINEQRKIFYRQRNQLIDTIDISLTIHAILQDLVHKLINKYISKKIIREDVLILEKSIKEQFGLKISIIELLNKKPSLNKKYIINLILKNIKYNSSSKEKRISSKNMRKIEKSVMLHTLDVFWKEHLSSMEYLRQSIHLHGYAQKDPKQEYKRESFNMFTSMLESIKSEVIFVLNTLDVESLIENNNINYSLLSCYEWCKLIYTQ